MSTICPAILADSPAEFDRQIQVVAPFADRIQIDLMDEGFTGVLNSMSLENVWWPHHIIADIHLMYERPFDHLNTLAKIRPSMVIIHAEANVHHMHFAAELHRAGIKAGIALLPETPITFLERVIDSFDHLLIFSGNLGHFGGAADMNLLSKIGAAKQMNPDIETGWDGGVKPANAKMLADGGVDVLTVGGYIQKATRPKDAYSSLVNSLD